MSSTVLHMSMSLDGFIAGPNESPDNGLGDGGERLHEWVFPGVEGGNFAAAVAQLRGVNRQVYDEMRMKVGRFDNAICVIDQNQIHRSGRTRVR